MSNTFSIPTIPPPHSGVMPCAPEHLAFIGEGSSARRLRSQVQRIGPYFRTALLIGENGTGCEDIARRLHELSPVAAHAFVACTALHLVESLRPREGGSDLLDQARHGTLFIDQIDELPLSLQTILMQQLQVLDASIRSHAAGTRLMASSRCDLRTMASSGQFRQDLYCRLAVVEIRLVPLRERLEDLNSLVDHLCTSSEGAARQISSQTLECLRSYHWPGNLHELQQVIQRALEVARGEAYLEPHHLPELTRALPPAEESRSEETVVERLEDVMRRHVLDVLARCAGNKLRAAELLGISRSTLYRMLDAASL